MIRGGSVGKEERPLALRGSPLRKSCGCQRRLTLLQVTEGVVPLGEFESPTS
jgi:hypothetical protein